MTLYLLRNASVLCEAGGSRDGFADILLLSVVDSRCREWGFLLLKVLLRNIVRKPWLVKGVDDL